MDEVWVRCPSFPQFEASCLGRVRNAKTARIRSAVPGRRGYTLVNYRDGGKIIGRSLHTLIADAFLGPRPHKMEVRHIDGNPRNSAAFNLAYGTAAENARDRIEHGRNPHGERNGNVKLPDAAIRVIREKYAERAATQRQLASTFGVSPAQIYNIVRNKQRRRKTAECAP